MLNECYKTEQYKAESYSEAKLRNKVYVLDD